MKMQEPVVFSDIGSGTWRSVALAELLSEVSTRSDAYISPCTYFPRMKVSKERGVWYESGFGLDFADQLCAFVLDIDRVSPESFEQAIGRWADGELPPTMVVCSGHGLHVYYVLSEPVEVRKRWRLELSAIGSWLYDRMAETGLGIIDRHGITQPYRVPGSLSKPDAGSVEVSAYMLGVLYNVSDLAGMAGLEQTDFSVDGFDMSMSLQSKLRSSRAGEEPRAKTGRRQNWGFYNWLLSREMDRSRLYGEFGHRYNQVVCLSVAARKNHVPYERLEDDVRKLYTSWNECSRKYGHPRIKWGECVKAMKVHGQRGDVEKFPRWWLEEKCGFEFGHQKRNGLTQAEHLAGVHRHRKLGSMSKLAEYLAEHPDATKNAAARDLGMSKSTVSRHWRMACAGAGVEDKRSRKA